MITETRDYLQPTTFRIPLPDKNSKIAMVQVEQGDKVMVGQTIAFKYNGKFKTPVVSSVSGTVTGFETNLDRFNKQVDHIIIDNDHLDTTVELKPLEGDVAPAVIRSRIAECGIHQVTVDGLFTDIDFKAPIEHVIINAIFANEPFLSINYDFIKEHAEGIADGIKLLETAALAKTATLIVDKYMDQQTLDALGKATVDKDIEVVEINTKKVRGWDYDIACKLAGEALGMNLLEQKGLYTCATAANMVHNAVREGKPVTERQVAVTGDAFPINAMYNVRIGTPFVELVKDLGGYDEEEESYNIHIGNFLSGEQVEDDSFSISSSIDAIHVSFPEEEVEDICIKCGECNDICPAGILPQNIMDAELRNVNSRIVELHTNECVECGLCSYVCPSKINVLEWVRRAKRRVG